LLEFHPPKPGKYTLKFLAGFTFPAPKEETWKITLTEKFVTRESISISIKKNEAREFRLYPSLPLNLNFELEHAPPLIPDGHSYFGVIEFQNIQDITAAGVPVLIGK
jgi:hypothetical protein